MIRTCFICVRLIPIGLTGCSMLEYLSIKRCWLPAQKCQERTQGTVEPSLMSLRVVLSLLVYLCRFFPSVTFAFLSVSSQCNLIMFGVPLSCV